MNDKNDLRDKQQQEIIETVVKNPELLEKLVQTPEFAGVLSIIVQQQVSHSGPLPMASEIVKYNEVIPNGANRIMLMAEKEQEVSHIERHKQLELRDKELSQHVKHAQAEVNIIKRGQWFSLIVIVLFTLLSGLLAILGDTTSAAILMGTGLVSIVSVLIYGQKNKK